MVRHQAGFVNKIWLEYGMWDFFRVTPRKRSVRIRKRGIIYHNPNFWRRIIFGLGNVVFLGALVYGVYLYYPLVGAILTYRASGNREAVTETIPAPTVAPMDYSFEIEIPKILAKSTVVTGVSPFDPNEYLKVLEADVVAQAKGSAMPGGGKGKTTYIFAHSTQQGIGMVRKNAVFYLLGEMKQDEVIFIKYGGQMYTYRVLEQKIVGAKEIEYLTYSDPDKELLILQTCWPIGTDWKRLLVIAERSDY